MFNKNTEFNDFLPPWIKFPENGCRPPPVRTVQHLASNQLSKGIINDVFDPVLPPSWTPPAPSTSLAMASSRGSSNRLYKAVLPEEFSKKILTRNSLAFAKDKQQQDNNQNQNVTKSNSPVTSSDEAEKRLLREMGWDEFQDERPLTTEEITTFKNLSYGRALQRKFDGTNNNYLNQNHRTHQSNPPQSGENLKRILLATMGVTSEGSDSEETDQDSEED